MMASTKFGLKVLAGFVLFVWITKMIVVKGPSSS